MTEPDINGLSGKLCNHTGDGIAYHKFINTRNIFLNPQNSAADGLLSSHVNNLIIFVVPITFLKPSKVRNIPVSTKNSASLLKPIAEVDVTISIQA